MTCRTVQTATVSLRMFLQAGNSGTHPCLFGMDSCSYGVLSLCFQVPVIRSEAVTRPAIRPTPVWRRRLLLEWCL